MTHHLLPALRRLGAASLMLAAATAANAQDLDPDLMQTRQKFSTQTSKKAELGYLLYLPPGYDAKAAKQWPLILFLHGSGERGTNLAQVSVHGPPKLKDAHTKDRKFEDVVKSVEQATVLVY